MAHEQARQRAVEAVKAAPEGYVVKISPATRSLDQSAKFHAICGDLAKSHVLWVGRKHDSAAWKVLLISGHSIATKEGADIIPGLENEFVNIRESSAAMSKGRLSSLIEYANAFCAQNSVKVEND